MGNVQAEGVDRLMTIGEFAKQSGLSAKRLRSYADNALLAPAAIDASSGYRYYTSDQLGDAALIDSLRQAGLSLREIKALLADPTPARLGDWAIRIDTAATARRKAFDEACAVFEERARRHRPEAATALRFVTFSESNIGLVRERNEDAVTASAHLITMCDGMGGAPAGELAASLAAGIIESAFSGSSIDELTAAVRAANRAILEAAKAEPSCAGMATTVCAIGIVEDRTLAVVNVGDTRAYLVRSGSVTQLTSDHTVTAELVQNGTLSPTDAVAHEYRRVLTRVLGVGSKLEVESSTRRLKRGDRLIVCTDGLFQNVHDEQITASLLSDLGGYALVTKLIGLALEAGGYDNITVAVADVA